MFWKRTKPESSEAGRERLKTEGWNACLEAIQEFLGQHSWVTEEGDRKEIFCDGCGASLTRKLATMRR